MGGLGEAASDLVCGGAIRGWGPVSSPLAADIAAAAAAIDCCWRRYEANVFVTELQYRTVIISSFTLLLSRFTYFDEVERLKMDFAEKQLQLQWKEKLSDVNRILILMEKVVEETEKDMEGKDCSEARAKFHNWRPCRDFAFSTLSDDFETIFSPWWKIRKSNWKLNEWYWGLSWPKLTCVSVRLSESAKLSLSQTDKYRVVLNLFSRATNCS